MAPKSGLSVTALWANSGVLVLPTMMAPAPFSRSTTTASSSGTWSAKRLEPPVVRTRRVKSVSLTETGTPWSGPRDSPVITATSAATAASRASSSVTVQ